MKLLQFLPLSSIFFHSERDVSHLPVLRRAPAVVAPLEVRFAHPVRLPPATHSQGKAAEKDIGIESP